MELNDPDGKIITFMNLLDGNHTLEELSAFCHISMEEVRDALALFDQYRLLESNLYDTEGFTERELLRYRNNFTYFSLHETMEESRFALQKKLKNAAVAVLGLGGGSVIAGWLAAMGVGRIVGVDYDKVELNNLNRQFFYTEEDVGEYKTAALQKRLKKMNQDIDVQVVNRKIESAHSLLDVLEGIDVVVNAIDTPPVLSSRFVNSACLHYRIPLFHASLGNTVGFFYRVSPFVSGCIDCRLIHIMRNDPALLRRMKEKMSGDAAQVDFGNPGFAPNVAILTALIASEIAKHLTNYNPMFPLPFTLINLHDATLTHKEIPRIEECPSCGENRSRHGLEPVCMETIFSIAEESARFGTSAKGYV